MEIDRQRVKAAFAEYTSHYDATDGKIKLKIDHTYRVAGLCDRIARSLGLASQDVDLAWLLGMLHDVGRFEQLRQYGTFSDADSIDHAHFATEILFVQGRLADYVEMPRELQEELADYVEMPRELQEELSDYVEMPRVQQEKMADYVEMSQELQEGLSDAVERLPEDQENLSNSAERLSQIQKMLFNYTDFFIIYTAVWNHSAYRVQEGLDERTRMFCDILRDADKVDILKVNQDVPIEVIYNVTTSELRQAEVTDTVMQEFFKKRAILRSMKRTCVDNIVGHAALVFELVYSESRRAVEEQGYLEKLLNFSSDNPKTREQFAELRMCMASYCAEVK